MERTPRDQSGLEASRPEPMEDWPPGSVEPGREGGWGEVKEGWGVVGVEGKGSDGLSEGG